MSTRTVIEINHDYLHDLREHKHISDDLFRVLCGGANMSALNDDRHKPQGIRFLAQRHHSETLKLEVR